MDKVAWIVVLVSMLFVLLFLFGTFILLYRSRKRLILEKHHDDIVEENIAVLYSDYLKESGDGSFSAFLHRKRKARKIRNVLLDIVLGIVGLVMLAVLAASIAYRFTGGQVYIGNTAFYVVETDSMSEKNPDNEEELQGHDDQIPARTFILIERLGEGEELVPYMIYAYQDKDGNVIVHRYIETMDDGTYLFRGDANALPIESDIGVTDDQIVGKFTGYQNRALGETIYFLKSPIGLVVVLALFGILVGQGVYADKLDRLYDQRYEILLPKAEEIHAKYVAIDGDREKKPLLLKDIAMYPEGTVCYVLKGDERLSTGERVKIVREESKTCLCRILSDSNPYDATPISIAKSNLAFDRKFPSR